MYTGEFVVYARILQVCNLMYDFYSNFHNKKTATCENLECKTLNGTVMLMHVVYNTLYIVYILIYSCIYTVWRRLYIFFSLDFRYSGIARAPNLTATIFSHFPIVVIVSDVTGARTGQNHFLVNSCAVSLNVYRNMYVHYIYICIYNM